MSILAMARLLYFFLVWPCVASQCPDSCSLLGSCNADGTCTCDPGFTSPNCGVLDLAPAPRHGGYHNSTLSSWGGKVIKLGTTYHMFASAMAGNCSLKQFSTNSMSVRATSALPGGPFSFAEIVLPPFHHSTTVVAAETSMPSSPNGLLMFSIGINTHGAGLQHCNATPPPLKSGEGHERVAQAPDASTGIGPHDYMSITTAPSVAGPWSERLIFKSDPSEDAWNCNKSNPSPVVLRNGTILLMYRGVHCKRQKDCRTATHNSCERQGIAVAKDAASPFVDRQGDIAELAGNEDAFFWQGKRGFHAIFHSKNTCGQAKIDVESCGSLAWSKDSWTWHMNKAPAYDKNIVWESDGRKEDFGTNAGTLLSRQRPKMLFDDDGYTPLFLYNGVKSELTEPEWTLAVPFRSAGSKVLV